MFLGDAFLKVDMQPHYNIAMAQVADIQHLFMCLSILYFSFLISFGFQNTRLLQANLIAQFNSVSGFLASMANSVTNEVKGLSKMVTETGEQAFSAVTEAVKEAQLQITALILPQSLADFFKASAEGMEMFSEYFWMSQPSVWDFSLELPQPNHAILDDDDDLHLLLVNQQSHRRRPVLCVGERHRDKQDNIILGHLGKIHYR